LLMITNPNLNCGIPAPTPTGFVLAINTHGVGMTVGDIEAGFWQMSVDIIVQTVLFFLGGAVFGRLGGFLSRRLAPRIMARQARKTYLLNRGVKPRDINPAQRALAQRSRSADYGSRIAPRIEQGVDTVGNIATGGPLGVDADTVADGSTVVSRAAEQANQMAGSSDNPVSLGNAGDAIYDYLNSPGVSDYPSDSNSGGPADAGPPANMAEDGVGGNGLDAGVQNDDGGLSDGDI